MQIFSREGWGRLKEIGHKKPQFKVTDASSKADVDNTFL